MVMYYKMMFDWNRDGVGGGVVFICGITLSFEYTSGNINIEFSFLADNFSVTLKLLTPADIP